MFCVCVGIFKQLYLILTTTNNILTLLFYFTFQLMIFKTTSLNKPLSTSLTYVRSFSRVHQLVLGQEVVPSKGHSTLCTYEWFFTSMNAIMYFH